VVAKHRLRIDRPGTSEEAWGSWLDLRYLPEVEPVTWPDVVVVAAHPDDEVLGAGGTMAILAAAGARLRLIAVTDGEGSHPGANPDVIARQRTAETAVALGLLGAPDIEVIRLRFPDTGLAGREKELTAALAEHCAGFGLCLAPWEKDAHADHEAAGRAARRAAHGSEQRVLTYPIWMWHWAKPADRRVPWHRAVRIVLPPEIAARKRAAISVFASQLTDRGPETGPILPPGIVAHFTREQEVLFDDLSDHARRGLLRRDVRRRQ
jgi:LmbE family N-acetylglucosaminyl deacetylase